MDHVRLLRAGGEVCTEVWRECLHQNPGHKSPGGWLPFPQCKWSPAGRALYWLRSWRRHSGFRAFAECDDEAVSLGWAPAGVSSC